MSAIPPNRRALQLLGSKESTTFPDQTTTTQRELFLHEMVAKHVGKFTETAKRQGVQDHTDMYVISIVGKTRQGKSTLARTLVLYLMLTAPQGCYTMEEIEALAACPDSLFVMCGGGDSITEGVYVWGELIPRAGGGFWILVDTEGTQQGCDVLTAQLTAVSTLLSSLLVYHRPELFGNTDIQALASIAMHLDAPDSFTDEYAAAMKSCVADLCIVGRSARRGQLEPAGIGHWDDVNKKFICDLSTPESKMRLNKLMERIYFEAANPDDGQNDNRKMANAFFPRRSHTTSLAVPRAEEPLLKCPLDLLDATKTPTGFPKSYRDVIQHLVSTAHPAKLRDSTQLIELLTLMLPAINSKVVDIPSVVLYIQLKRGEQFIIAVIQDTALPLLAECDTVAALNTRLPQIREKAAEALQRILSENNFVESACATSMSLLNVQVSDAAYERTNTLNAAAEAELRERTASLKATNDELQRQVEAQKKLNEEHLRCMEAQKQIVEDRRRIEEETAAKLEEARRQAQQHAVAGRKKSWNPLTETIGVLNTVLKSIFRW